MKGALGWLALLTMVFVGGLIALPIVLRCTNGASSLPCGIIGGFAFLLALVGSSLSALILGVIACYTARRHQRWGWFGLFLSLTVLVGIGTLTFFSGSFNALNSAFLSILFLVAPLALVAAALVYRRKEG